MQIDRSEFIFLTMVGLSIAVLIMIDLQRRNRINTQAHDPINKLVAPKPQNEGAPTVRQLYAAAPIGNVIPVVAELATGAMKVNGGFGE